MLRDFGGQRAEAIGGMLVANLPAIADAISDYGNAVFVFLPGKPIRAQQLPLGVARN